MANAERNHTGSHRSSVMRSFIVAAIWSVIAGCGGRTLFVPPPLIPDDTNHVDRCPESIKIPVLYDSIDKVVFQQIRESLDFSRQLRNIAGHPKQAFNVNAFDEIDNSSWFTNRNAAKQLGLQEIARGPDKGGGPETNGIWEIKRAKLEGVTPGFTIKDSRGDRYLIKFDPKGFSELATGAEVISTKLFYAAGYNTPENYIVYFNPGILRLDGDVEFTDEKGHNTLMTEKDLQETLEKIEVLPDGRIRALASKYVPGKPIGPFRYQGIRKDDPNDFIPHQHRRELRGLQVICAWLKHTDTKDGNSLDSFVDENGASYVKHFLIDFGSTLGSAARGPFPPEAGYVYGVDPTDIVENALSLGTWVEGWEKDTLFQFTSIGRYRSGPFEPRRFKSMIPNPAFDLMTNLDGYWGAKLVTSFTDDQLQVVVEQALYSDPEAEAYLLEILRERRDIIGRYWFSTVNPLDRFELYTNPDGTQELRFVDLAVDRNLEPEDQARYRYDLGIDGGTVKKNQNLQNSRSISVPESLSADEHRQLEFTLRVERNGDGKWSKWVKVYLEYDPISGRFSLLGLRRQE